MSTGCIWGKSSGLRLHYSTSPQTTMINNDVGYYLANENCRLLCLAPRFVHAIAVNALEDPGFTSVSLILLGQWFNDLLNRLRYLKMENGKI
jgi:hypothetical protein